MNKPVFLSIFVLIIAGCATSKVGMKGSAGFKELTFPSNSYGPGQIVEIYSSPEKVEVTYQPQIPLDKVAVSPGWNISIIEVNKIESLLAAKISTVAKAHYSFASQNNIQVKLTDTKAKLIPKSIIFNALRKDLQSNYDLKSHIAGYMSRGAEFCVITMTLSARVSFSIVDSSDNEIVVDPAIIEKINSELGFKFKKQTGSNKLISGEDLVVGIHYDRMMIGIIMSLSI
jgi:hypothetical protein